MKKKLLIVFACAIAFIAGACSSSVVQREQVTAEAQAVTAELNRSPELKYPLNEYRSYKPPVYILQTGDDKYYHNDLSCQFMGANSRNNPFKIHVFEAEDRGFKPCPDCVIELTEHYDASIHYYDNR